MDESASLFSTLRRLDPELAARLPVSVISDATRLEGITSIVSTYVSESAKKFPTSLVISKRAGVPGGCVSLFESTYNDLMQKYEEERGDLDGIIKIEATPAFEVKVQKKVLVILKSLLTLGVCPDMDLADACRDLFLTILRSNPGDSITEETMHRALRAHGVKNYYAESLMAFIETL